VVGLAHERFDPVNVGAVPARTPQQLDNPIQRCYHLGDMRLGGGMPHGELLRSARPGSLGLGADDERGGCAGWRGMAIDAEAG
jgi:hypothetical protein